MLRTRTTVRYAAFLGLVLIAAVFAHTSIHQHAAGSGDCSVCLAVHNLAAVATAVVVVASAIAVTRIRRQESSAAPAVRFASPLRERAPPRS